MFENLFSRAGLSLDRLRSLVEIDAAGGISQAAPGDVVRQSQLSRNLSQLETFFGVELKRRVGRGIELTVEGKRLAALAREYLRSLEGFLDQASGALSDIRIGSGHSTLEWIVLPAIEQLRRDAKRETPHIILESVRSQQIIERLNDFSLDLAVVRKSALTSKKLRFTPIVDVTFSLYCHSALAKRFNNDVIELVRKTPLALAMGGDFRRRFGEWAQEHDISPKLALSCSSFRLVFEALKSDIRLASFLPDTAEDEAKATGLTRLAIPGLEEAGRELVLAWNERIDDLRPGVKEWREAFLQVV
ncbi:LysR family transcriptional regulator [Verrucomicrobiales bacterium BCK34]|nr:LysR family transcriptional regulator [Verrucomicrobiales bacterium BCK34]